MSLVVLSTSSLIDLSSSNWCPRHLPTLILLCLQLSKEEAPATTIMAAVANVQKMWIFSFIICRIGLAQWRNFEIS